MHNNQPAPFLWNFATASLAFSRFSSGSHVSSKLLYPFHRTRYCFFPLTTRSCRTASTSNSSSVSPASRMGAWRRGAPSVGLSYEEWKTGWMRMEAGSSKRKASRVTASRIVNGPVHLAASFLVPTTKGRLAVDNQTFCPTCRSASLLCLFAERSMRFAACC